MSNSQSRFNIILADVPWSFDVWSKDTGNGRSASAHYDTMDLDSICKLPVKELAADNCALFFWAVWPRIFDAEKVINAWGFTYKTLAWDWLKLNRSGIGFHIGMGYYARANPEPALLAVRGNMPVAVHNERNTLIEYEDDCHPAFTGLPMAGLGLPLVAPIRKHSQKPDSQYSKIEALYPTSLYPHRLELFARRRYSPEWKIWGNQAPQGSDIVLRSGPTRPAA